MTLPTDATMSPDDEVSKTSATIGDRGSEMSITTRYWDLLAATTKSVCPTRTMPLIRLTPLHFVIRDPT